MMPEQAMKVCTKCKTPKAESSFYFRGEMREDGTQGRMAWCKSCTIGYQSTYRATESGSEKQKAATKKRRDQNPERFKFQQRVRGLKHRFGLGYGDYERMRTEQNRVCAICKRPEIRKINGKLAGLCVDHSHDHGHVRGLLCASCNTGLGAFKDDKNLLQNAIVYLLFND